MTGDDDVKCGGDVAVAASCKLPPFLSDQPQLWLRQVESTFVVNRIKSDDLKYHLRVGALDGLDLREISDILRAPPETERFKALEAHFAESAEQKLETILNRLELGDKKPSQLYRQMVVLASTSASENLLKVKWAVSTQELLDVADTVVASPISLSSFAVSAAPKVPGIQNRSLELSEINELLSQLIAVSRDILTHANESNNNSLQRQSRSPNRDIPQRRDRSS